MSVCLRCHILNGILTLCPTCRELTGDQILLYMSNVLFLYFGNKITEKWVINLVGQFKPCYLHSSILFQNWNTNDSWRSSEVDFLKPQNCLIKTKSRIKIPFPFAAWIGPHSLHNINGRKECLWQWGLKLLLIHFLKILVTALAHWKLEKYEQISDVEIMMFTVIFPRMLAQLYLTLSLW